NETYRITMLNREGFAVHRICQQRVSISSLIDREAALEMNWIFVPGNGTAIRTAEQDLSSPGLDAGAIEHLHRRYPDPLRRAHGSQVPLLALDWRIEQHAAVAGALESDDESLRRHLPKVAHAEPERALHQAAHCQTKGRWVEIGNLKMIADVEMR